MIFSRTKRQKTGGVVCPIDLSLFEKHLRFQVK